LEISDRQWPTLNPTTDITASFVQSGSGYSGRITITFDEDLYFLDTSSGSQQQRPVTSTTLSGSTVSGNWVTRNMITGDLPIGWSVYTETGEPRNTRQMSFECSNVSTGDFTFSIRSGLCDEWGNMPGNGQIGFQVTVHITKDNKGEFIYSVSGVSNQWNSTRPESRPTT